MCLGAMRGEPMGTRHLREVRAGPEARSELEPYGWAHRMIDREEEREGSVSGKMLVIQRGEGPRNMDKGDDPK